MATGQSPTPQPLILARPIPNQDSAGRRQRQILRMSEMVADWSEQSLSLLHPDARFPDNCSADESNRPQRTISKRRDHTCANNDRNESRPVHSVLPAKRWHSTRTKPSTLWISIGANIPISLIDPLGGVLSVNAFHEKAGRSQVILFFSLDKVFLPADSPLSPCFHPHSRGANRFARCILGFRFSRCCYLFGALWF